MAKYEAHITLQREDVERIKEYMRNWPWWLSQFDSDPGMGADADKPYCYLTKYDTNEFRLQSDMGLVCDVMKTNQVPILRTKIERIIFDSKTGIDEINY